MHPLREDPRMDELTVFMPHGKDNARDQRISQIERPDGCDSGSAIEGPTEMAKIGCIMGRRGDVAWFVLYRDGTWAGGFIREDVARKVAEQNGGNVVKGEWFD